MALNPQTIQMGMNAQWICHSAWTVSWSLFPTSSSSWNLFPALSQMVVSRVGMRDVVLWVCGGHSSLSTVEKDILKENLIDLIPYQAFDVKSKMMRWDGFCAKFCSISFPFFLAQKHAFGWNISLGNRDYDWCFLYLDWYYRLQVKSANHRFYKAFEQSQKLE